MEAHELLLTRPCLEEIDGWLLGRKVQGLPVTEEILGPIETYRKRLLAGKEIPTPSRLEREWVYQRGRKPVFKPKRGPR